MSGVHYSGWHFKEHRFTNANNEYWALNLWLPCLKTYRLHGKCRLDNNFICKVFINTFFYLWRYNIYSVFIKHALGMSNQGKLLTVLETSNIYRVAHNSLDTGGDILDNRLVKWLWLHPAYSHYLYNHALKSIMRTSRKSASHIQCLTKILWNLRGISQSL